MRLTNRTNLPEGIYRAVERDPYDSGRPEDVPPERYFTPTRLIAPTQQTILKERHGDEIEEDAGDRIWSLLGQAVHTILERAAGTRFERVLAIGVELSALAEGLGTTPDGAKVRDDIRLHVLPVLRLAMAHLRPEADAHHVVTERRFYATLPMIAGEAVTIGGALDALDVRDGVLSDYKVTSVYSAREGAKIEWVIQNSVNAWLCRKNGKVVNKAENVVIYRDWSVAEAGRNPDYPQQQVATIETPIWPDSKIEAWIVARVTAIRKARELDDSKLPEFFECSSEERWNRDSAWVVKKQGNKMAVPKSRRNTREEAEEFAEALRRTKPGVFEVEFRPGQSKRCEMYCAARDFCHQWSTLKLAADSQPGEE